MKKSRIIIGVVLLLTVAMLTIGADAKVAVPVSNGAVLVPMPAALANRPLKIKEKVPLNADVLKKYTAAWQTYSTACAEQVARPGSSAASSSCGSQPPPPDKCYRFRRGWGVYNSVGQMMYAWLNYFEWCASGSTVTLIEPQQADGGRCQEYPGGFFEYRGCTSTYSGVGHSSDVNTDSHWEFRQYVGATWEYRRPATNIHLTSDGGVSGTVFWE
jgi:hypothetical protein